MNIANNKVYVPSGGKVRRKSLVVANAMAVELLNYGVVPSTELILRIASHSRSKAKEYANEILKQHTIGDVNPPLFKNWESRTYFSFGEVVAQIFGYMLQISGNDLADANYMEDLRSRIDFKGKTKLKLASEAKAKKKLGELLNATVAQDRANLRTLVTLAKDVSTDDLGVDYVRSDEARVALADALAKTRPLFCVLRALQCKPADVMRIAAFRKDVSETKLPHNVLYANLNWQDRKAMVGYLGTFDFEDLSEAMGHNRAAWTRFFSHIHLMGQKEFVRKHGEVAFAAYVASRGRAKDVAPELMSHYKRFNSMLDVTGEGSLTYRTFESRLKYAVEKKSWPILKDLLEKRPSYLLRNLMTVSNGVNARHKKAFLKLVETSVKKASVGVLFSLVQIDEKTPYRVIDVKGSTTIEPANYPPFFKDIRKLVKKELKHRFGFEGKVFVEEGLKDKIVPFLAANGELDRGSSFDIPDAPYMYFFMHWVQPEGRRTDLDHSWFIIKNNGSHETISFYNQANSFITQSGDITNAPAPHGGTEYTKVRLDKLPRNVRYLVPSINVYCGMPFSENNEAYAGFFFSDSAEFNINADHVRYDLTQPAHLNFPFVIDVKKNKVVILDYNQESRYGSIAESFYGQIQKILQAKKKVMTIGKLAKLLSGDDGKMSLKVTTKKKHSKHIEPQDLYTLFS